MMITITIDQRHVDEALNALCDCSPADIDEAGNQLAAIEAISLAVREYTTKQESGQA